MKRSISTKTWTIASLAGLIGTATAAHSQGFVTADYDFNISDAVFFIVHNTTTVDFTSATLTGTDSHGSATEILGTILPGASATTVDSDPYFGDYDDYYRGEAIYTFYAINGNSSVTSTFSPSMNATGHFVDFLGNDANGNEADIVVPPTSVGIVVNPSGTGTTPGTTPEPGAYALLGSLCLTGVTLLRRKRAR